MFPKLNEIQFKRRMLGLTQEQLAREVGVSQSAVAKIETGNMVPNYNMARRIFEALEKLSKSREKTAVDVMVKRIKSVGPDDALKKAAGLMVKHGISNLPVLEDRRVAGRISEGAVVGAGRDNYSRPCRHFMEPPPVSVGEDTPVSTIREILRQDTMVAVVGKEGRIRGIVSRADVI